MDRRLKKISTDEIDLTGQEFVFSFGRDNKQLEKSVEEYGIINPPIIFRKGKINKIILGYRRILAAVNLNMKEFTAYVKKDQSGAREILEIIINDNLTHRKYNIIEKSFLIKFAAKIYKKKEILENIFPLLGLKRSGNLFNTLIQLADQKEEILSQILCSGIFIQGIDFLMKIQERETALNLLLKFNFSKSNRVKILKYIYEISQRGDISESKLFSDLFLEIENKTLNTGDSVINYLYDLYKPEYCKKKKLFDLAVKNLKIGNLSVKHTPFFENREIRFSFKAGTFMDFKKKTLNIISRKNDIKDLFKILE